MHAEDDEVSQNVEVRRASTKRYGSEQNDSFILSYSEQAITFLNVLSILSKRSELNRSTEKAKGVRTLRAVAETLGFGSR
jgi:hypothetical protein